MSRTLSLMVSKFIVRLTHYTAPALGFTEALNDDYIRGRRKVEVYNLMKR